MGFSITAAAEQHINQLCSKQQVKCVRLQLHDENCVCLHMQQHTDEHDVSLVFNGFTVVMNKQLYCDLANCELDIQNHELITRRVQ